MKNKQLILKVLKLKNFKGIKELTIPVQLVTTISGDNATGKTTINDAATWLLFGKDSQGRSDFEVQPLDDNNQVIHFLDTEVEGVFELDGSVITIKRLLQENWQKPKGQADTVLKGTTTSYYINEVPRKQKEYVAFINDIIDEKLFKILTNPFSFESLPWKDKRKVIFDMCGDVSDEDVVQSNEKLNGFIDILSGKNVDDLKKIIAERKKKLKDDISKIPARIDELTSSLEEIDVASYQSMIERETKELHDIEDQLESSAKAFESTKKKQQQIISMQQQLSELRNKAWEESVKDVNEKKVDLSQIKSEIRSLELDNQRFEPAIESWIKEVSENEKSINELTNSKNVQVKDITDKISLLRKYWEEEDSIEFTFDPSKGICPHCGQTLPLDKYQEAEKAAREHFDKEKTDRLDEITRLAGRYTNQIEEIKASTDKQIEQLTSSNTKLNERINNGRIKVRDNMLKLEEIQKQVEPLETQIKELSVTKEVQDTDEMKRIKQDIECLQKEVECAVSDDNTELKDKKSSIQKKIDEYRSTIARADVHEKTKQRFTELEDEYENAGQLLRDLEQQEFMTEEFTRTKVNILESRINNHFKYVTFKLFDQQVNGGISECCESLINGVPFSNANNAAKINAGLDIINALVSYYEVSAPIFIDNAESVNELICTSSQVIRLVVSHDPQLEIC